jgi:hypothetical protein
MTGIGSLFDLEHPAAILVGTTCKMLFQLLQHICPEHIQNIVKNPFCSHTFQHRTLHMMLAMFVNQLRCSDQHYI